MSVDLASFDPAAVPEAELRPLLGSLFAIVTQQAATIRELEAKLSAAVEEIERLKSQRGSRPRGPGSANPKPERKPRGRRPGEGEFKNRTAPDLQHAAVEELVATVALQACAECGGELRAAGEEIATTVDLPQQPCLLVKRFTVQICACAGCGKRVRGRHPELPVDQRGATAHRLGQLLRDTAQWMHYKLGISMRKVPEILYQLYRVRVTQSAFTQDALRQVLKTKRRKQRPGEEQLAAGWELGSPLPEAQLGLIGQLYQELRALVATQARIHTDDTGWWVDGYQAWLMVFCNPELVVFQIRYWHRNQEVRELLPSDFQGTVNCDGGSSYGAKLLATVKQQKCLSHVLRLISEPLRFLSSRLAEFPENLKRLLQEALAVHRRYRQGETVDLPAERRRLGAEIEAWLKKADPDNLTHSRLAGTIGGYHAKGQLLRFLEDPEVDPTNNRAERELRLLVIARKISQCSKNDRGAEAQAAWASLFWTLDRRFPGDAVAAIDRFRQAGSFPALC